MDRVFRNIKLSGDFQGNRDADIEFRFRFCDDGVYFYMVQQVGIWRLAHRGRFEIRSAPAMQSGGHDRKVVRLSPAVIDVEPSEAYVYGMLSERGLPAKNTEDYLLSVYQYDHAVNPNIKLRTYIFCIPGKTSVSGVDWSIEQVNS